MAASSPAALPLEAILAAAAADRARADAAEAALATERARAERAEAALSAAARDAEAGEEVLVNRLLRRLAESAPRASRGCDFSPPPSLARLNTPSERDRATLTARVAAASAAEAAARTAADAAARERAAVAALLASLEAEEDAIVNRMLARDRDRGGGGGGAAHGGAPASPRARGALSSGSDSDHPGAPSLLDGRPPAATGWRPAVAAVRGGR
jgi:hypothetical protein